MIPDRIKVGGYTVIVKYVPNLMTDHQAVGMYCPRTKEIHLDPASSEEQLYATFLHEIIEAITEIYELQSLTDKHHDIVLLSEALHQILRDNGPEMLP